jgi:hypothetical protein
MTAVELCSGAKLFGKASTGKPAVKRNVRTPVVMNSRSCFGPAFNLAARRPTSVQIPALVLAGTISIRDDHFPATGRGVMARKYSKKASADVERAMKKRKAGTLKSGRSGKKVTSRKQAIAIALSEARAEGKKVPKKAAKRKKAAKKRKSKK